MVKCHPKQRSFQYYSISRNCDKYDLDAKDCTVGKCEMEKHWKVC